MEIKICYKIGKITRRVRFTKSAEDENARFTVRCDDDRFTLEIEPKKEIELVSVTSAFGYEFRKNDAVFLNGYQSWTDSHEHRIDYRMRGISHVPKAVVKKYALKPYGDYAFADYSFKRGRMHGFTYAYTRRNDEYFFIGSLCEKTGFTAIYFDTSANEICLKKDCKGLFIHDKYKAFDVAFSGGTEDKVFDEYFRLLNIAPPKCDKISGFTSWYRYYQNISEDIVLDNLSAMKNYSHHFDVFQIDDGYQTAVGDWLSVDKKKFPHSMKMIADEIKDSGMLAGIWLAPFACEFESEVVRLHPEWLLRDDEGNFVIGGGNWGGFYVLDLYNNGAREYIRNCFDVIINEWGFSLLKLDFLYAVCIMPRKDKTRGQIMAEAMDFLRECVGDKLILGCGVPLGSAFGKVEYCRIGCDVGLDYDDKPYMRLLHRERVSTKNSMGNTIFRRQLSGRAFINDPDVFLLRDNDIELNKAEKKNLASVNSLFGGVLFTSDNLSEYDEKQKEIFNRTVDKKPHKADVMLKDYGAEISAEGERIFIRL